MNVDSLNSLGDNTQNKLNELDQLLNTSTEYKIGSHFQNTENSFLQAFKIILDQSSSKNVNIEEKHYLYNEFVKKYSVTFKELEESICKIEDCLKEVNYLHESVSNKTEEVRGECNKLLEEQKILLKEADQLRKRLFYFDEIDRISARLRWSLPQGYSANADAIAGEKLIANGELKVILEKLEGCLEFLTFNKDYRESKEYIRKYKQLHLRVLNCVKSYLTSCFQGAVTTVIQHKKESRSSGLDIHTAAGSARAFVEFRAVAKHLRPVIQDIELKSQNSNLYIARPYVNVLKQCLQTYFFQRDSLLHDDIEIYIQSLTKTTHLLDLARLSCNYLIEICTLEYQLFQEFFSSSDVALDVLRDILSTISNVLYTQFRPVILQESEIDILCQVADILKYEIMEQEVVPRGDPLAPFGDMVMRIVADVQERLCYRSEVYIRDSIDGYIEEVSDIAYPEKLNTDEEKFQSEVKEDDKYDPFSKYYPTLKRTLTLLSKLYNSMEEKVFQYLAQKSVSACIRSLVNAKNRIRGSKSSCDGFLFLIKHLLVLREQLSPFDVDFCQIEKTLDFSHMKNAVGWFFEGKRNWNSLLQWVERSEPKIKNTQTDSRKDLEVELKNACELFITDQTQGIVGPLLSYFKMHDILSVSADNKRNRNEADDDASQSEMFNESHIDEMKGELRQLLSSFLSKMDENAADFEGSVFFERLKSLRDKMKLYLASPVTENILFKPIKNQILEVLNRVKDFSDRIFLSVVDDKEETGDKEINDSLTNLETILHSID